MTKRNLLLVSLVLVFGLATASSLVAQVGTTFNVSNNTNYDARYEGDAEGVGTVTLTTVSNGTIKASSFIAIDYNVPIAKDSAGLYAVGITVLNDPNGIQGCMNITIGTYGFHSTPSYPPKPGVTNNDVFIRFSCDVYPVAGTTINVASRVNVQGYPTSGPGAVVAATVRANSAVAGVPLTVAPSYDAAYIVAEVNGPATTVTLKEGPEYVLTCLGVKEIHGTAYDNDFELNIAENWSNALTSLSDEWTIENNDADNHTTGSPVFPTNGSNILITLFHIPPNVTIEAGSPVPCWDFDISDAGYCALGTLVIEPPVAETPTTGTDGLGVQDFWYVVDVTNTAVIENADFGFWLRSHGPLPPNQNYQITAQVRLTDDYPTTQPNEMPYFTLPEGDPMSVVEFKDCVTKLLFPYVNAFVGGGSNAFSNFGTGINFANTTADPFANMDGSGNLLYPDEAKGTATPQSGNCAVYLYPTDASAAVLFTTPTIPSGGSFAFDVGSSASTFQGKTGYAIAICNFQNGHGFAEIYDNYGIGAPTATLGYLAEVLPDPAFYHRSPAGDGLGEGAITPININRFIRKFLMCGPNFCH